MGRSHKGISQSDGRNRSGGNNEGKSADQLLAVGTLGTARGTDAVVSVQDGDLGGGRIGVRSEFVEDLVPGGGVNATIQGDNDRGGSGKNQTVQAGTRRASTDIKVVTDSTLVAPASTEGTTVLPRAPALGVLGHNHGVGTIESEGSLQTQTVSGRELSVTKVPAAVHAGDPVAELEAGSTIVDVLPTHLHTVIRVVSSTHTDSETEGTTVDLDVEVVTGGESVHNLSGASPLEKSGAGGLHNHDIVRNSDSTGGGGRELIHVGTVTVGGGESARATGKDVRRGAHAHAVLARKVSSTRRRADVVGSRGGRGSRRSAGSRRNGSAGSGRRGGAGRTRGRRSRTRASAVTSVEVGEIGHLSHGGGQPVTVRLVVAHTVELVTVADGVGTTERGGVSPHQLGVVTASVRLRVVAFLLGSSGVETESNLFSFEEFHAKFNTVGFTLEGIHIPNVLTVVGSHTVLTHTTLFGPRTGKGSGIVIPDQRGNRVTGMGRREST